MFWFSTAIVLSLIGCGAVAYAGDPEVESAKNALSRAQNEYYDALKKAGKKGDASALREQIVAPAAQQLGKTVQKRQDAVVRKSMKIDKHSNLPANPDTREFDENAEFSDSEIASSPEERKVIQKILGEGESAGLESATLPSDDRRTKPSEPQARRNKSEPSNTRPVAGSRPGRRARPMPQGASAPQNDNSLAAPPKEGEGVNVMEF